MKTFKILVSITLLLIAALVGAAIMPEINMLIAGCSFEPMNFFETGGVFVAAPVTLLALIDQRKALLDTNAKLLKDGKDELRSLSEDEQKTFDENKRSIEDIDRQITNIESIENANKRTFTTLKAPDPKKSERFNLLRCIRDVSEGRTPHDADLRLMDQGRDSFKMNGISPQGSIILPMLDEEHPQRADILAGTDTAGSEIVGVDHLNIVGPLRNALVFSKVGATFLPGLVGNVDIPKYSGSTAAWKGEVAAAGDGAGTHSDISLAPLRITAYMDVSKLYLTQDAVGAEELLKSDIVAAVSGLLEATILSKTAASAGVNPAGLLLDADSTFDGAGMAWADIVSLETAVDTANALNENLAYITHPGGRGYMKTTVKVSSTDSLMLMDSQNEVNGYPCLTTSNMSQVLQTAGNETGVVFANWRHLLIGQWGGIDLVIDPYTLANTAQVRITVNSYWDYAFRHAGAIAFGSSTLA